MIKGLGTAGLGQVETVEELITLASRNGFKAVDTKGKELRRLIENRGIEGARAFLKEKDVQIGTMEFPVEWRQSDAEFSEGLGLLMDDLKTASQLGCKTFFTYFMPSTDQDPLPYLFTLTKRIKLVARLLKQYDMNLALEFVGPYHLRTKWKNPFISDIRTTIEWLELIGETNVGIVLDSFHWHSIGGTIEDITSLKTHQIAYVHINDARDVALEEVLDNDRLYPGEGVIDLIGFLRALKEINYVGVVSQEILTLEEPVESSEYLAEKSRKAFDKVFTEAALNDGVSIHS